MKVEQEDKEILRRLLHLFKPYIKNIVIITFCLLLSAGLNTLVPLISKRIVDDGLIKNDFNLLIKLVLMSFLVVVVDQGIGFIETRYRVLVSSKMPYELTKKAFKQTMKLNMRYFNNTNYAEIMNNINMDVRNISRIADTSLFMIAAQLFKMIGGVVGLCIVDWKLTIVVLAVIPVKYKTVKMLAKKRQKIFRELMEANSDYYSWYGDTISGVKEVKLLGLENSKIGEFIKKQRRLIKIDIRMNILDKVNVMTESFLFEIITGLLYILGAYLILKVDFTVGGLMAFITYSVYVIMPISSVLNIGYSFSDIVPSAKRFFKFLDMEQEEVRERSLKRIAPNCIEGSLKFENIFFKYNEDRKILKGVSFEILKGEKVAIIGPNGSGKTTLINLFLRFLKPDSGRILIDNNEIEEFRLKDYRQLISVVSQEAYLFNTTIKKNILPFHKKCDEKLSEMAKESKLDGFIEKLPGKYDTVVGSNGSNLSGGQRQKVAMARAFAREAKIMVLDEATSNYDMESEHDVMDMVINRMQEKTVLIITHKLPVLKVVDRIIFIENGEVADIGKHDELYVRNKVYKATIDSFNRNMAEDIN